MVAPGALAVMPPETVAGGELARPRLVQRVLELLDGDGAVALLAGPGYGKSTLARLVAAQFAGVVGSVPAAGLQLDRLRATVDRLRSDGLPALLVVDDAHLLAPEPGAGRSTPADVLDVRAGVSVLLCAAGPLGRVGDGAHAVPVLDEADLRFAMGEVESLRSVSPATAPMAATEAMRLTGGWPQGVDAALRLDARDPRLLDLLGDAVESAVLDHVAADELDFLLRAAALAPASRDTVTAVLGTGAAATWERLRTRRLPMVSIDADQVALRRPLLDHLRSELARRLPGTAAELRAAYVAHLRASGRLADLVDWHVSRGSLAEAHAAIAEFARTTTAPGLLEPFFDRWTAAIGIDVLLAEPRTAGLVIRALHHRGQTEQAAMIAQRLVDDGRMDPLLEEDPGLRPVVVYVLHNRPQVALRLLPVASESRALGAFAYSVAVTGGTDPVEAPDRSGWGEEAIHVIWGLLWQGRLAEAVDAMTERGVIVRSSASLVLAALWSDRDELADEAYRLVPKGDGYPWAQFAQAALALHRGEHDKGLRVLGAAMPAAQRTQAAPTFETLASYLILKSGGGERAVRSLEARLPQHDETGRLAMGEWTRFILALGHLEGDRPQDAIRHLEDAVPSMERAERLLLLGASRIAYAEARARLGASEESLRQLLAVVGAAQDGLGSPYWEREARGHARELRRLGLVAGSDTADAGSLANPAPATTGAGTPPATVEVARLSAFEKPPLLETGGSSHPLGRTKLAELVADLAVHGGTVDRTALQARLFPDVGQRSAGNHFRQVLFKLRELTGVVLDRPSRNEIGWPAGHCLTSSDLEFEDRTRALLAEERVSLESLCAVLDLVEGPYLRTSDLAWVTERRQTLDLLYEEGVARLLRHPSCVDDLDLVRTYGERAVALCPYSEDIYRLMIEAELERGSAQRARATYRRAVLAMRDLGLEPSGEIRLLAGRIAERLATAV